MNQFATTDHCPPNGSPWVRLHCRHCGKWVNMGEDDTRSLLEARHRCGPVVSPWASSGGRWQR